MGGKMLICDDIVGTFFKKYKCADCNVKLNRSERIFDTVLIPNRLINNGRNVKNFLPLFL